MEILKRNVSNNVLIFKVVHNLVIRSRDTSLIGGILISNSDEKFKLSMTYFLVHNKN